MNKEIVTKVSIKSNKSDWNEWDTLVKVVTKYRKDWEWEL